jgi:hypothetical protein
VDKDMGFCDIGNGGEGAEFGDIGSEVSLLEAILLSMIHHMDL